MSLILAIFPGLDVLGMGFEAEGYCVVRGPDVLWAGDIARFHPPRGVFEGVVGGDPCQSHSALANLVRAKGLEPSFPDMTPDFERIVEEARPRWFLRENVPGAPDVKPAGYDVRSFLLDHSTLDRGDGVGYEQMRRRRFWFGVWGGPAPELRAQIDFALTVLPEPALAVNAGHDHLDGAERIGQRRRHTVDGGHDATPYQRDGDRKRKTSVTARHDGEIGVTGGHAGHPPRYSLAEMLELQGLPPDLFAHSPFTVAAQRKLVGNAVAMGTARALARAIRQAKP